MSVVNKRENIYTDEMLLSIMKDYNNNIEFPTKRKFTAKNQLPSYATYSRRFGSFQNAIVLSGIEIPKDKERYFERSEYSKEEIKTKIKEYVDTIVCKGGRLPICGDIARQDGLPSISVIYNNFGSLGNLYEEIGYDIDYNDKLLREQLTRDYIQLEDDIGRVPTVKDLNDYSRLGKCHSATTFAKFFGGIDNLKLELGYALSDVGRNKTDGELLKDLSTLLTKIGRTPIHRDFLNENDVASVGLYNKRFGSVQNALEAIGVTEDSISRKTYITKNGTVCLSSYEYRFACLLESKGVQFLKDPLYKDFINNFNRKYKFDFMMMYGDKKYFIEIFGMVGNNEYDLRTKEKIKLCKDNNIPLIGLYPEDFWTTTQDELFLYLEEKIDGIDRIYYASKEVI